MHSYVYDQKKTTKSSNHPLFLIQGDSEMQKIITMTSFLAFQIVLVVFLSVFYMYKKGHVQAQQLAIVTPNTINVLSAETTSLHTAPTATPTPSPTPTPTKPLYRKSLYTVILYGDSMVDTMGEVCEYAYEALKKEHPDTEFLCYNYGKGSENVTQGLGRFGERLEYQSRRYPPVTEIKPDICVMGSFAYNVYTPHDRNQHWLDYTRLIQQAQQYCGQVYMLAEIAPLRADFGKGPNGVNWETKTVIKHSGHIIDQLENVLGLSKTLGVPLIDAYTPSKIEGQQEGKREYVNASDGIHPSIEGHKFMAEQIAKTVKFK